MELGLILKSIDFMAENPELDQYLGITYYDNVVPNFHQYFVKDNINHWKLILSDSQGRPFISDISDLSIIQNKISMYLVLLFLFFKNVSSSISH